MHTVKPIILLTRPRAQSAEFRKLLGTGLDIVESPVLEIEFLPVKELPKSFSAIIFSSGNGVLAAEKFMSLRGVPAFAVGDRTAAAARHFGMKVVSAGGTADDLIAAVIAASPTGTILFVRGKHSTGSIENSLKNAGIETESIVAYDQIGKPLSKDANNILTRSRPVLLPLFSARSAGLVSQQMQKIDVTAPLMLVAMSDTVLDAWSEPVVFKSIIADKPTAAEMAKEILRQIR